MSSTRQLLCCTSLLLACLFDSAGAAGVPYEVTRPRLHGVPIVMKHLSMLRGGADADDDLELDDDDDLDDIDDDAVADDDDEALANPFLAGDGSGLPAMPDGGPGLQDLASTLNDPAALQEALKQLQDPAIQSQVRQMLEDPTFQDSMKQYMEQITKDPQFEALKKQTEAMLQEEGFVEKMSEAFSSLGGLQGALGAAAAGGEEKDE